ncbi:hypothetical protein RB195_013414 [Necator americanus]|uniref:SCP domain-containing protein n=1 Tax=Necator americanus TaxID=51031 RepID=A0ABR1DVD3_NECAM
MQYALTFVVFAVSLSGSLQDELPMCNDEKYGLNDNTRDQLYNGIKPLMKSGQLAYKCELEVASGMILEDPNKDFQFTEATKTYPLIFEVEAKDGDTPSSVNKAALKFWEKYIPHLGTSRKAVGCGYLLQWGYHKFICLFDDKE